MSVFLALKVCTTKENIELKRVAKMLESFTPLNTYREKICREVLHLHNIPIPQRWRHMQWVKNLVDGSISSGSKDAT